MNFIEKLLPLSDYNTILVIVNQLSKQDIFVPIVDIITLYKLAKLFLIHVFSKHGIPSYITSDCGIKFISNFFRSLEMTLNIKLHFTSGYHSERDSQMECTNQTLEQYLYIYYNYQQNNWLDLLLLAKFVYNNIPSTTTSVLSFFTNKRYYPNIIVYLKRDITSSCTCKFTVDLDKLQNTLKMEIFTT